MIFVCIASCLMLIYWVGCAVDETVIPWLFALTDGKFPPANAFGGPFKPFTALVTYSEHGYMLLQIAVLLLEVVVLLYVLCKKDFRLPSKLTACIGVAATVVFIAVPESVPYIFLVKGLISVLYFAFVLSDRKRCKDRPTVH